MRTPHLSVRKGKRVRIILRTGETFVDKFVERKGSYISLENHGLIATHDIRAMSIYKPRPKGEK